MLRAILVVAVAFTTAVVSGEWCGSFSCPRSYDSPDQKWCCATNRCCDGSKEQWTWTRSNFSLWPIFTVVGFLIAAISIACRCYFLRKHSRRNQSQAAPVAQPVQNLPGQYPLYPPTQPPAYPQYPPGQPPPYPQQPPPYPQQPPPYPQQPPPYTQQHPGFDNPAYPQNPPAPDAPPKM
ncbi:hypothetical protein Bbelb_354180 [Branchiostoma belcheri]|nr:hypothetical protein Bbelb_354180 [Branchiostoma belcheri]